MILENALLGGFRRLADPSGGFAAGSAVPPADPGCDEIGVGSWPFRGKTRGRPPPLEAGAQAETAVNNALFLLET